MAAREKHERAGIAFSDDLLRLISSIELHDGDRVAVQIIIELQALRALVPVDAVNERKVYDATISYVDTLVRLIRGEISLEG